MSAVFYAEDLGVSISLAQKIADVMQVCAHSKFCVSAKPWAGHGKVRVYIEPWSQNSLPAIDMADKVYFDFESTQLIVLQMGYGSTWLTELRKIKSSFSGAKTRNAAYDLVEAIDEQKKHWD